MSVNNSNYPQVSALSSSQLDQKAQVEVVEDWCSAQTDVSSEKACKWFRNMCGPLSEQGSINFRLSCLIDKTTSVKGRNLFLGILNLEEDGHSDERAVNRAALKEFRKFKDGHEKYFDEASNRVRSELLQAAWESVAPKYLVPVALLAENREIATLASKKNGYILMTAPADDHNGAFSMQNEVVSSVLGALKKAGGGGLRVKVKQIDSFSDLSHYIQKCAEKYGPLRSLHLAAHANNSGLKLGSSEEENGLGKKVTHIASSDLFSNPQLQLYLDSILEAVSQDFTLVLDGCRSAESPAGDNTHSLAALFAARIFKGCPGAKLVACVNRTTARDIGYDYSKSAEVIIKSIPRISNQTWKVFSQDSSQYDEMALVQTQNKVNETITVYVQSFSDDINPLQVPVVKLTSWGAVQTE